MGIDEKDQCRSKYIIEYDEKGRTIKYVEYNRFENYHNKWLPIVKRESQYNDKDSLIQEKTFYYWGAEKDWGEPSCIKEYKYENNKLISKTECGEWGGIGTTIYFYDESDNNYLEIKSNCYAIEREFDHNNNVISKIVSRRDCEDTTSTFLKESKKVFSYNEKNKTTIIILIDI
jgi:hypothetical protein